MSEELKPEGQGGGGGEGEWEEAVALAARIVEEYTMYDFGMSPANELKLARALLSSTPEGGGGGERLATRLRRARLNGLFDPSLALQLPDDNERVDQLLDALEVHLLSSPRVEEVRREALEEAAKIADNMAINRARVSGVAAHACKGIAASIRALSPPVVKDDK